MPKNISAKPISKIPAMRFGTVPLTAAELAFRHEMNQEMMDLLRSLPESVHTDAAVLLMEHFKTPFFPEFNYFQNYFAPSWSIIYWLERLQAEGCPPWRKVRRHALRAHAMALFLHPLDDHLDDGQLPASHLNILLRSQAWLRMNTALEKLTVWAPDGAGIAKDLIDDYYASIGTPPAEATLDGYCAHFRKQMATWMTVPVLMAAGMTGDKAFVAALQTAYGAFGTAWRLLDDMQDVEADMAAGSYSAIFYLLPLEIRPLWYRTSSRVTLERQKTIRAAIIQEDVMGKLRSRILMALTSAAKTMETIAMPDLAEELDCLAKPLADGQVLS